jgi:predicted RNA-binding Zn ribbon-like protein
MNALLHMSTNAGPAILAPAAARTCARPVAVREAIYRLARARLAGEPMPAADVEAVNAAAAATPVTEVLAQDGLRRAGTADEVLATLARAAVVLLGGQDAGRVRQCEDPPCTRLFVDTSRARSRRWCEMSGCGNRAKVAGYRARRSAAGPRLPGVGAERVLGVPARHRQQLQVGLDHHPDQLLKADLRFPAELARGLGRVRA